MPRTCELETHSRIQAKQVDIEDKRMKLFTFLSPAVSRSTTSFRRLGMKPSGVCFPIRHGFDPLVARDMASDLDVDSGSYCALNVFSYTIKAG